MVTIRRRDGQNGMCVQQIFLHRMDMLCTLNIENSRAKQINESILILFFFVFFQRDMPLSVALKGQIRTYWLLGLEGDPRPMEEPTEAAIRESSATVTSGGGKSRDLSFVCRPQRHSKSDGQESG